MIRNLQTLHPERVIKDLYNVSEKTMWIDARRECWICGQSFVIGDSVTVAMTDKGNKLLHTRCYKAQAE